MTAQPGMAQDVS